MLHQCNIFGLSAPVVFRSKAQYAGNGRPLSKCCNAAAGHHRSALRVSLSASMDCVTPLGKGIGETRLAMNADKLTEPENITLMEH